jgi:hypothetical protein
LTHHATGFEKQDMLGANAVLWRDHTDIEMSAPKRGCGAAPHYSGASTAHLRLQCPRRARPEGLSMFCGLTADTTRLVFERRPGALPAEEPQPKVVSQYAGVAILIVPPANLK